MGRLSKYERETIILTNELDSFYKVYTYNSVLKRKLAAFARKYPEECRFIKKDTEGSVTYEIDKGRLVLKLEPPYGEKRLQNLSREAKLKKLGVRS